MAKDEARKTTGINEALAIILQGPTMDQIKAPKLRHGGHFTIFGQTFYYGTHRKAKTDAQKKLRAAHWRALLTFSDCPEDPDF